MIIINLEEAPPEKRIRFYEVHDKLHNQFNVSATHTAKVLKAAFPQTERKRVGREKHSYYTRITWKAPPVSSHPQPPPQLVGASPSSLPLGLVPVTQPPPEPPSVAQLLARNYELESRVKHLEERMEKMVSAAQIEQEVAFLVQSEGQVVYGPDTPERFQSFSLDQVSREVQSGAPTLYVRTHSHSLIASSPVQKLQLHRGIGGLLFDWKTAGGYAPLSLRTTWHGTLIPFPSDGPCAAKMPKPLLPSISFSQILQSLGNAEDFGRKKVGLQG